MGEGEGGAEGRGTVVGRISEYVLITLIFYFQYFLKSRDDVEVYHGAGNETKDDFLCQFISRENSAEGPLEIDFFPRGLEANSPPSFAPPTPLAISPLHTSCCLA